MDGSSSADFFVFESFRLDRGGLFRLGQAGTAEPVALGSRALDLLLLLVKRQGQLVSKDEIIETVWQGMAVEEGNLTVQVSALRRVLDQCRQNSCIQTVIGRGYRFIAPVRRVEPAARQTISPPSNSPRLSIVVLPFAERGGDPKQQYFADALTDDLTTDLSRIADMLVISRNTAFTYRNKPVDTKQTGREVDVRYVLEGSVRRWGNRFHVNAQLIDTETDLHLWAERFEGDSGNLSAVANDIIVRIAHTINIEVVSAEGARRTHDPDALDYILCGSAVWWGKKASRDTYADVIGLYERALALDPQSVEAQSLLAQALVHRQLSFPDFGSGTGEADIRRAQELAAKAVAASPRSYQAHYANGEVLRAQRRCVDSIAEYEIVIALNRNWVYAHSDLGRCKLLIGQVEEAIPAQEQAIRLSPREPAIAVWYQRIAEAHLLQLRIDQAVHWLEKARGANAGLSLARARLAAAYGLKGETECAAAELAEARRLGGEGSYLSLAQLRATSYYEAPSVRALAEATYYSGLRKAGMPET
jgi:adenylate cyclase